MQLYDGWWKMNKDEWPNMILLSVANSGLFATQEQHRKRLQKEQVYIIPIIVLRYRHNPHKLQGNITTWGAQQNREIENGCIICWPFLSALHVNCSRLRYITAHSLVVHYTLALKVLVTTNNRKTIEQIV